MEKIAVPAKGPEGLDAIAFGQPSYAPFFTIVTVEDSEIKKVEVIRNPASGLLTYRGPSLASWLKHMGVTVLISISLPEDVLRSLTSWGIRAVFATGRTVREILDAYLSGTYRPPRGEKSGEEGLV
ncbi:MAG: NifB/NifX family molybdenum-iron cluster-binding protein [Candidatus Korarchaeota archaeon]|nr:NifB/NifX family molybdenum-iron cluster-binding protein [Candidatus Korarchaeota archaeon]